MVMVFATHQYESAIDIHMCPLYPEAPSNFLPHPIPPGCYLILYWPALLFFKNSLLIRAHCISLQNESMGLKCSKGSFRLIPSNKWKENSNKELEVFSVNHTLAPFDFYFLHIFRALLIYYLPFWPLVIPTASGAPEFST